jgi:hypothetical protein
VFFSLSFSLVQNLLRFSLLLTSLTVIVGILWICAWIAVFLVRWWRFKRESLRTVMNLLQFDSIFGSGKLGFDECSWWFLETVMILIFDSGERIVEWCLWCGVLWMGFILCIDELTLYIGCHVYLIANGLLTPVWTCN